MSVDTRLDTCGFDVCYVCRNPANEIARRTNEGGVFQAIGHAYGPARYIHAVCLECIRAECCRPRNVSSLRKTCGLCRAELRNTVPAFGRVVHGRLFTLRSVPVMGEEGQVRNENGEPPFIVEIIRSEDMPPHVSGSEDGSEDMPPHVPVNSTPRLLRMMGWRQILGINGAEAERLRRQAERVRRAGRSRIEVVTEAIGRELFGRVISLVICGIGGAALVVAYFGTQLAIINAVKPDEGIFVPKEKLNGLSEGFVALLLGGAISGVFFGIIGALENPWGDTMERVGCLAGKAIVRGLEGLNDLIERINIAWAELFAVAAPQPVQV